MFPLHPSGVTHVVAYERRDGIVKPVGLIIKNIDVSMGMHTKSEIRMICEVDEDFDEASHYPPGQPIPPQYPPPDALQTPDGAMSWKEYRTTLDGKELRTVYASAWSLVDRINCFCCSCSDNNPDPHCRNHGFAGRRACEKHGTTGEAYTQETINHTTGAIEQTETMPQSIEQYQRER